MTILDSLAMLFWDIANMDDDKEQSGLSVSWSSI